MPQPNPAPQPSGLPVDPVDRIYQDLGEDRIRLLIQHFYQHVRQDNLIGPMYPENDWQAAEQRLADFLIQRFGGPATYSQQRGHPRLRMRHMPFAISPAARDRWLQLMDHALTETDVPPHVADTLRPFFHQVATFMINRPADD